MNLADIRRHVESDKAFADYVGDSADGMTLNLVTHAIEIDGETLADFEVLELIAEIIYTYQHYINTKGHN